VLSVVGEGSPAVASADYQSCISQNYDNRFGYPPGGQGVPGFETAWCLFNDETVTSIVQVPNPNNPNDPNNPGGGGTGGGGTGGGGTGGGGTGGGTPLGTIVMPIPNGSSTGTNRNNQKAKPPLNNPLKGKILYEPEKLVLTAADLGLNFQPYLGQYIAFRETIIIQLENSLQSTVYAVLDRVIPNALVGYYQLLRERTQGVFDIIEEQKIVANISNPSSIFAVITRDFAEYTVAEKGDFFGAFNGEVVNCNADIRPGLVGNTEIPLQDVPAYAALKAQLLGSPTVTAEVIAEIVASPVAEGFKFPKDKPLFTTKSEIPVVKLDTDAYLLKLQQNGIFLLPGWEASGIEHVVEVIGYKIINKREAQISQNVSCNYALPN
jgi:hypothetical protein